MLTDDQKACVRLLANPELSPSRREMVVAAAIRQWSVPRYVYLRRLAARYQRMKNG